MIFKIETQRAFCAAGKKMPYLKKNTTSIADLGGLDDLDLTCPDDDEPEMYVLLGF